MPAFISSLTLLAREMLDPVAMWSHVPAEAPAAEPARPRPSLLRSALEYSVGAGLGLVGSILRVGMAARLLSADERGLWIGLQLGFGYAVNLHLGSCDGMLRAVPMLRARGDIAGAEAAKQTTLTFVVLMTLVGSLGLGAFAAFTSDAVHRRYFVLTGVLTAVTLLKGYYTSVFKGESRFRELSVSAALGSVTSILTVGLIWVAGLDGLIWGMIVQAVVELAWLVRKEAVQKLGIDLATLRGLLAVGLLVLATNVLSVFFTSVDRTVMLSRLGTGPTGYYYLGANIVALLPVVAGLPTNVLTPRFFELYGATSRGDSLVVLLERSVRAGSVVLAVIMGAGVLLMAPVVALLWPGLTDGVEAARIAALGTFPVVLFGLVSKVFYAMNRLVVGLVVLGIGAGSGLLCAPAAVTASPTIAAAAAGSVVGLFTAYVLGVLVAYQAMVQRWKPGLALLVKSLAPAALAVLLVLLCDRVGGRFWPAASMVRASFAELVFCACFGPWVLRVVRRLRAEPIR